MDTWDIHLKQRMSDVDPVRHILDSDKKTYTFVDRMFPITDEVKSQIENYVVDHFIAGLKQGPQSHRWRLVGKIFLHWPSFKDVDFQNPVVLVYHHGYKVMTGITRLWAKCLMQDLAHTKALIFHKDENFAPNAITSIHQAQDLFLTPLENMLISVDYYDHTDCYFVNEFDFMSRDHMKLFLGQGTMAEFEKFWVMLHESSRLVNASKYSREHIVEGVKLILSRL